MNWLLIGVGWLVLATAAVLVIGRAIRIADRRSRRDVPHGPADDPHWTPPAPTRPTQKPASGSSRSAAERRTPPR